MCVGVYVCCTLSPGTTFKRSQNPVKRREYVSVQINSVPDILLISRPFTSLKLPTFGRGRRGSGLRPVSG